MIETFNFHNFGYIISDISDSLKEKLEEESTYILNNFENSIEYNRFLAGHLQHEYKLISSVSEISTNALQLAEEYDKIFNYTNNIDILTNNVPMCIEHPWINFQSKGEFNPVHNHKGIYSFVIWLKIPYDLEEELKYFSKRETALNSAFQFQYVGSLGQIATHQIYIDKSFENKIMLFPSKMMHCVYPFYTSNEYRISVAGNIMLHTGV